MTGWERGIGIRGGVLQYKFESRRYFIAYILHNRWDTVRVMFQIQLQLESNKFQELRDALSLVSIHGRSYSFSYNLFTFEIVNGI